VSERPLAQHVAKDAPRHVSLVLHHPPLAHDEPGERVERRVRRDARAQLDARAVGDAPVAAHHLDALPRRREALERAAALVPGEDPLARMRQGEVTDEVAHGSGRARGAARFRTP
jgi:hypothetical protein